MGKSSFNEKLSPVLSAFETYEYLGKGGFGVVRGIENLAIKKLKDDNCKGLKHEFEMSKRLEKYRGVLDKFSLKHVDILYTYNYTYMKNRECFLVMPRVFAPECSNKDHLAGTVSFSLYTDESCDEEINNRHIVSGDVLWSMLNISDPNVKNNIYKEFGILVAFMQFICKIDPVDFQGLLGSIDGSKNLKLYVADFGMYKPLKPKDIENSILESIMLNVFLPIPQYGFWEGYITVCRATNYYDVVETILLDELTAYFSDKEIKKLFANI